MTEASAPGMATSRLSLRPPASTSITEAVSSALSLGLEVGARDTRMDDAYAKVADAAARNGKLAGSDVVSLDGVRGLAGRGYRFFTYGGDLAYLTAGVAAAGAELRQALKPKA